MARLSILSSGFVQPFVHFIHSIPVLKHMLQRVQDKEILDLDYFVLGKENRIKLCWRGDTSYILISI